MPRLFSPADFLEERLSGGVGELCKRLPVDGGVLSIEFFVVWLSASESIWGEKFC